MEQTGDPSVAGRDPAPEHGKAFFDAENGDRKQDHRSAKPHQSDG